MRKELKEFAKNPFQQNENTESEAFTELEFKKSKSDDKQIKTY